MQFMTLKRKSLLLCLAWAIPLYAAAADIAGFGRIQPAGGIVNVSASSTDTISRILVHEGEQVEAGQVLAVLSSSAVLTLQVEEARLALDQAKQERDDSIHIAEQQRQGLKDDRESAKSRLANLYANQAESYVSPEYIQDREGDIAELEQKLEVSALEIKKLRATSDLSVKRAEKQLAIAESSLADASIRSPLAGRVLKVLGRPGEHVGPVLFLIGDTATMYVLVEVYESDALRVKPGQKAVISSSALPQKLGGVVESVGTMIYKSTLESLDTSAQTNSRVVETLVRLDPNPYADRLINLQVDVVIRE